MKKIFYSLVLIILSTNLVIANEKKNCDELKFASDRFFCKAFSGQMLMKGSSAKKEKGSSAWKEISIIPKSLKDKKTLADFFKNKEE